MKNPDVMGVDDRKKIYRSTLMIATDEQHRHCGSALTLSFKIQNSKFRASGSDIISTPHDRVEKTWGIPIFTS